MLAAFNIAVAFVLARAPIFKFGALLLLSLVAFLCGLFLPSVHSRAVAEVIGLIVAAFAGRLYLP